MVLELIDVLELEVLELVELAEVVCELETEELWVDCLLEVEDVMELSDELGIDDVEDVTDVKPELDFVLVTELEDRVAVWLLEEEALLDVEDVLLDEDEVGVAELVDEDWLDDVTCSWLQS